MRYGCLIYTDEARLDALHEDERKRVELESREYEDELRRGGHLVAAERLASVRTATTLRMRGGRMVTSDGPAAEAPVQLAGLLILEARDLNEALRLAARAPASRFGGVEVRPVRSLTP